MSWICRDGKTVQGDNARIIMTCEPGPGVRPEDHAHRMRRIVRVNQMEGVMRNMVDTIKNNPTKEVFNDTYLRMAAIIDELDKK